MLVDYLERGVLAGAIAGIAYGAYMAVVANPLIGYMETVAAGGDHAHAGEHAHEAGEHAHAAGEHAHAVSEATTAAVSVGSGVLWGILLGGVFALAFYFLEPALPGRGRVKTYVLAGAGFLTVSVAPWLVLPPTTPGAEQAFDPTLRIAIYAGLMAVGAVVAVLSVYAYRRVSARSRPLGGVAAALPIVALVAVTAIAAPTIVESGSMPADLVTAFRGLTALSQAALWALVAGCFGWLQTRAGVHSTAERRDDLLASP
ncbi:CbtA family protein [Natrinema versiforme]|uniref:Cobalamin cluster protein n=1 Tax=Natrinema versiforme JCM 10478 TaxID=1227496 RepID=L9XZF5_9EURY|nr:CbtA family protein [Natrinema versiforme]ELY67170.1 hypothetical protein C489_11920 [Natrinema versiforme JCM 10478]